MNTRLKFRAAAMAPVILLALGAISTSAQEIGQKMTNYLHAKVGMRIAGGESWQVATEALRVGGGEFVPGDLGADSPNSGDRVWGDLVTVIAAHGNEGWSNSNSSADVLPGDVIQYGGARFGETWWPSKFTAVVAEVNQAGRPSSVYQQNKSGDEQVSLASIDVTNLSDGWLRIYRPKPREDAVNVWKFTTVNKSAIAQEYGVIVEITDVETVNSGEAGTAGSYRIHKITTDGTVPALLLDNGENMYVENGKAYEFLDGDWVHIRQKKY